VETNAGGDEALTLAAETSRHDGKLVEMADPDKGNKIAMTTVCNAALTRIAHHAAAITKSEAPAAMMTRTKKIQLHVKQREAFTVAASSHRMSRARKDEIPPHPH
jgi:hypothetical protein